LQSVPQIGSKKQFIISSILDIIAEAEKTPLVCLLIEMINNLESGLWLRLEEENRILREDNRLLKEEINNLKKLKNKPNLKPSKLNDPDKPKKNRNELNIWESL
jgi:hypothetical protein